MALIPDSITQIYNMMFFSEIASNIIKMNTSLYQRLPSTYRMHAAWAYWFHSVSYPNKPPPPPCERKHIVIDYINYTPANKVWGYIGITLSVRPSVCPCTLQMCMKEYGCCPKFKRGDKSTYTFMEKGGGGGMYLCTL